MNPILESYRQLLGSEPIDQLQQISSALKQIKIVHVNSTRHGGGVAEILEKMVPLTKAIGINAEWVVIDGNPDFFQCTKIFHNSLQGIRTSVLNPLLLRAFEEVNAANAEHLRPILQDADIVIIHDPQPLPLIDHFPNRKGKWIWRCHIDVSNPNRSTWKYLREFIKKYDASIFSIADFVQPLPHPIYLIAPSIDPLSEKNIELEQSDILAVYKRFNIDMDRPMILQVSRFDHFKDPLGVIAAYHLAKKYNPNLQLVLAGGGAPDDPEGEIVLNQVNLAAKDDPDIHILFLPADSHHTINALQRAADIVLQKSLREGFGLTVTEALWKSKPVIGGNTGGIRLQIINYYTGFLVNTPEGAALRIRQLLFDADKRRELGEAGRRFVKENFLITRHLREYMTVVATLLYPDSDRILVNRLPQ